MMEEPDFGLWGIGNEKKKKEQKLVVGDLDSGYEPVSWGGVVVEPTLGQYV